MARGTLPPIFRIPRKRKLEAQTVRKYRIRYSPNSFFPIGEITRTISLYIVFTCCGSIRESENLTQSLRFIMSENIPVSSAAAQLMNKDRKHVGRRKHLF